MEKVKYKSIIGHNIKRVRKENSYSREKLAECIDVSADYIGKLERGNKGAGVDTLIEIANCFSIPLSLIVSKETPENAGTGYESIVKSSMNVAKIDTHKGYVFLRFIRGMKLLFNEYLEEIKTYESREAAEHGKYRMKNGRFEEVIGESNRTLIEMAQKLNMTKEHMYNLKNNNVRGSVKTYIDICNEMKIPIDVIFAENLKNTGVASMELEKEIYGEMSNEEKAFLESVVPFLVKLFMAHGF